jgi:prolyl oligopeptidase
MGGDDLTPSLFYQKNEDSKPKLLFDPNGLIKHADISIDGYYLSPDNNILALALSVNGSDWKTIRFLDMKTKNLLNDTLDFVKYSELHWFKNGLFYMKYDVKSTEESFKGLIKGQALFYHKIGTKQSEDLLVFKDENEYDEIEFSVTPRYKYLVIDHIFHNAGKKYYAVSLSKLSDSLIFRPRDFIITTKDSLYFDVVGEWGISYWLKQI